MGRTSFSFDNLSVAISATSSSSSFVVVVSMMYFKQSSSVAFWSVYVSRIHCMFCGIGAATVEFNELGTCIFGGISIGNSFSLRLRRFALVCGPIVYAH